MSCMDPMELAPKTLRLKGKAQKKRDLAVSAGAKCNDRCLLVPSSSAGQVAPISNASFSQRTTDYDG